MNSLPLNLPSNSTTYTPTYTPTYISNLTPTPKIPISPLQTKSSSTSDLDFKYSTPMKSLSYSLPNSTSKFPNVTPLTVTLNSLVNKPFTSSPTTSQTLVQPQPQTQTQTPTSLPVNNSSKATSTKKVTRTSAQASDPNICYRCEKRDNPTDLITCVKCSKTAHSHCWELPERIAPKVKTYDWQCFTCKV